MIHSLRINQNEIDSNKLALQWQLFISQNETTIQNICFPISFHNFIYLIEEENEPFQKPLKYIQKSNLFEKFSLISNELNYFFADFQ
jgi:hypothetical protein